MFGIIMTTRGSAAPRGRPDRDRVYRFPGGEATGPEDRAGPAAPAGRGRQAAGGPAHGPRLFESKSRSPGEADIDRARRLLAADLNYVAHPSFHDPGARDAILAPAPGHEPSSPEGGFPSREQEAHLFRRMNYLKYLACRIRDRLDPEAPDPCELDQIDRLRAEALGLRNRIIETHLRLVMMVAGKHVTAAYDLQERVSDGTFALMRAAERFDFARGYRFSTYATWAIFNQLVQCDRRERRRARSLASYQYGLVAAHPVSDWSEPDESPGERAATVERLLRGLDRRERRIVVNRHGIGGVPERTLKQIGTDLGISKERVRQIEKRAYAKLRGLAGLAGTTPSDL